MHGALAAMHDVKNPLIRARKETHPHALETHAVEEGAIRVIARAAEHTTSVDIVRLCASTLCNFAGDGRARPKMSDSRTAKVTHQQRIMVGSTCLRSRYSISMYKEEVFGACRRVERRL